MSTDASSDLVKQRILREDIVVGFYPSGDTPKEWPCRRIGYEVIEIPNATLKIQHQDEAVTTPSAVGESGC